jgi:hypothetical protein
MPDELSKETIVRAHEQHISARFERWLREPTVRLLVSMIPPGPAPELVQTLLREAYTSGADASMGFVVGELATRMLKAEKP